jgi:glucose/arabinose dehydrogenase/mono/diheme cytochrome c family protein
MNVLLCMVVIIAAGAVSQGCNSVAAGEKYVTDSASIVKGEKLFRDQCAGCHNFRQNGIGPNLSGVTDSLPASWVHSFIDSPEEMVKGDDPRADFLAAKYKTIMPSFSYLGDSAIVEIMAYINAQKNNLPVRNNPNALSNPIPGVIPFSDLTLELEYLMQFPPTSEKAPLTRITFLQDQPELNRKFVLDLRGKIYSISNNQASVYMDMSSLKPDFINQPGLGSGFGSFCFHPEFLKNGLLYTTHTEKAKSGKADFAIHDSIKPGIQWVITEWKLKNPGAATFSGEGRELFRIDMVTDIHGVQQIAFNPYAAKGDDDFGLLYIGIGDGGAAENGYDYLISNNDGVWGTIFRIDPSGRNSTNRKYGIPPSNPFVRKRDVKSNPEIYSYGYRNPHRLIWLRDKRLLAANIGNTNIESVYLVEAGADSGWPNREGSFVINPNINMDDIFPLPANDSLHHVNYPVIEYDHDEGKAIAGGYEYTGNEIPALKGKFCFADLNNGRVFFVNVDDIKHGQQSAISEFHLSLNGKPVTLSQLTGISRVEMRLGQDSRGELYILTKPDGKLYRIKHAQQL